MITFKKDEQIIMTSINSRINTDFADIYTD